MEPSVVIYGAGGHGKVIAEILLASGCTVSGFIDDHTALTGNRILDLRVFAAEDWLRANPGSAVALGIGDNRARSRAAERVVAAGGRLLKAIHPNATVARTAKIANGVAVMAAAVLNPDCEIQEGAIINTGAIVEHDVTVGRYAHLSPRCTTGGGAQIGEYAHIGIGAIILPLKRVGAHSIVGAGAVVTHDIADDQIAFGIPAKVQSRRA